MSNITLSICIPTYNRNEKLVTLVRNLLLQVNERCEIVVIDNASDNPIEIDLHNNNLLNNNHIKTITNKQNIGAGANLLKCIENATGEWIWILGDDDFPANDAIKQIEMIISQNPDFVNFIFDYKLMPRQESYISKGLSNFIEKIDSFGKILYISMNVYNRNKIKKYLQIGYENINTKSPHVAMLLSYLNNESGKVLFTNKNICSWEMANAKDRWNFIYVGYHIYYLLDLYFLSKQDRKMLSRTLDRDYTNLYRSWLPQAIIFSNNHSTKEDTLFYVKQFLLMYSNLRYGFLKYIFHLIIFGTLHFSSISFLALRTYKVIFKKNISLDINSYPKYRNRL